MKFRYKIILALTISLIMFNVIFGFFTIQKELGGEEERFKNKIDQYNSLIVLMNIGSLWDFDSEKIRSNLDLIFRDPEVVAVSLKDITGRINISLKKENNESEGKIYTYNLGIIKDSDKLGDVQMEYSNLIYTRRLTALIFERILLTLGLIIINIAAVFFISSYLVRPIDSVVNGLRKIDEGDFNHRMSINTADEFKQIEKYFNRMVENLSVEIKSRIEKEEQLVEIHKYLTNVFDSIPSVLITVDKSGIIIRWNYEAEKFTGIKSNDAINKSVWELVPILKEYRSAFSAVMHSEKKEEIQKEYISPEKDEYINISISPLISDRNSGAVIRLDNVTEMKQKDEKLVHAQMMDTIGNLAGGLAHDFNNILTGITTTVSLIKFRLQKDGELSIQDLKKFLDIIDKSGIRATDLIKQFLSLSRKDKMNLQQANLNPIIKQVAQFCEHTLDKSVEIRCRYFSSEAMVIVDPSRIEQVLLNLCINASHSMTVMRGEGEIRGGMISIDIDRYRADEFFCNYNADALPGIYYWRISVRDEGVGIEKKVINKIFEPFFTTKARGKGSGLGLSMSYNIIKQHGGFIGVYSAPGKGSVFTVYIPAIESENDADMNREIIVSPGSGLILVVDEDKLMSEMASSMLRSLSYEVMSSDNPEDVIKIFKENFKSIKAVLVDMIIYEKKRKELFVSLKEIDPDVRVIITSGFRRDETIGDLLEDGVYRLIQKPFSIEDLSKSVYEVINS